MRFKRLRRLPGRKLGRPEPPAAALSPDPPALILPEDPLSGASTEFAVPSVIADPPRAADLPTVQPYDDPDSEPNPPSRMPFVCPCGAKLVANTQTYDKHSRCAMCQTELLLNLVYDPEQRTHEIVPFRVDPNKPL